MFVGGSKSHYYSAVKYKGYLRALDDFGIKHNESVYCECGENYSFKEGFNFIEAYLQSHKLPEAFVAASDLIALGIARGLENHGIKIPKDVSLVGFDDIDLPELGAAELTTVRIPLDDMARLCMEVIREGDDNKLLKQYIVQPEMVIRQSVKVKK